MHTVAVLDNGAVYSWGVNDEGALGRQTEGPLWEKAEVQGYRKLLALHLGTRFRSWGVGPAQAVEWRHGVSLRCLC